MPTFDFQCKQCGHTFEFTRPFASKAKPSCPSCSSKRVEKLIAPPAVHFKGAGWYKTDSKPAAPAKKEPVKTEEKKSDEKKDVPIVEKKGTKGTEGAKETKKNTD